jgi:hypothetical protein
MRDKYRFASSQNWLKIQREKDFHFSGNSPVSGNFPGFAAAMRRSPVLFSHAP